MATFNELLSQAALSVLDPNQQSAISQQQDQLLQNSLVKVRREIAELKSAIEIQDKAFNPALELKETLAQKQIMEKEMWVEIQTREHFTDLPSFKGRLVMRMEEKETEYL